MLSSSAMGVGRCSSVPDACRRTCGSAAGVERTRRQAMLRGLLISTSALALVLTFAMEASANPKNKFGDGNVATADAVANANETGRASCRECVCQYVKISVVDGPLQKKRKTQ